ncbi:MAG: DUF1732 domain-containing protein [Bacteroidia bacterium]|nr:DUF1732 domain-containing protein [Bacteroidia bacterium]
MKSMTGFGHASLAEGGKSVKCDVRTLNGKGMDVYLHSNIFLGEQDLVLRKKAEEILQRGRVDIYITLHSDEELPVVIHTSVLKKYYSEIQKAAADINADMSGVLSTLIRMEGVSEKNSESLLLNSGNLIEKVVTAALHNADTFRRREGEKLKSFFLERIKWIENYFSEIRVLEPGRLEIQKEKIRKQLLELSAEFDMNRLEQELIYYAEKMDIREELDRFGMHLEHLKECMNEENPGKKMVFFCQELHREINTLSNKAAHAGIQKWAVSVKEEIEKFREQAMNVV